MNSFTPTTSGNFLDLRNDQRGGEAEILIWPRFFRVRRVRGLSHNPHQPDIHIPMNTNPPSLPPLQQSPSGTSTMITEVIFTWEEPEEGSEGERENEKHGRRRESQGIKHESTRCVIDGLVNMWPQLNCVSAHFQFKSPGGLRWLVCDGELHRAGWPNLTEVFFYCVSSRWRTGGESSPSQVETTRDSKPVSHWWVNAMCHLAEVIQWRTGWKVWLVRPGRYHFGFLWEEMEQCWLVNFFHIGLSALDLKF